MCSHSSDQCISDQVSCSCAAGGAMGADQSGGAVWRMTQIHCRSVSHLQLLLHLVMAHHA